MNVKTLIPLPCLSIAVHWEPWIWKILNHTAAVHYLIVARSINGEVGREAAYQFIHLAIGELMKYLRTNIRQTATQINIFNTE